MSLENLFKRLQFCISRKLLNSNIYQVKIVRQRNTKICFNKLDQISLSLIKQTYGRLIFWSTDLPFKTQVSLYLNKSREATIQKTLERKTIHFEPTLKHLSLVCVAIKSRETFSYQSSGLQQMKFVPKRDSCKIRPEVLEPLWWEVNGSFTRVASQV